ncbi:MAG: ammonia channel protein, partial [Myxococcota bacterium]
SLDAFGVHGVGGTWGAIASGLFATTFGAGIETRSQQLMVQLEGVAIVLVLAPVATFILLKILGVVFGGLRVEDEAEFAGLDLSEHHEAAYTSGGGQGD